MMKAISKSRICFVAAAVIFMMAAVFIYAPQVKAATEVVQIGGTSIADYNDNEWHSAGQAGSPAIPGWTDGKFKLSENRSTLYLEGVKVRETDGTGGNWAIFASHDLTIHVIGNNTFENYDHPYAHDGEEYCDLVIEGDSGSSFSLGTSGEDPVVTARNITISGCDFSSGNVLWLKGTLTVDSGSVSIPSLQADNLHMTGGTVTAASSGGNWLSLDNELKMENGDLISTDPEVGLYAKAAYIDGGSVTVKGQFRPDDKLSQTGGSIEAEQIYLTGESGDVYCSGGSMTATDNLLANGGMTINGGSITAQKGGIDVGKSLIVTDGKLVSQCSSSGLGMGGLYVFENLTLSGGTISAATEKDEAFSHGVFVGDNTTISGGEFSATSKRGCGVRCRGSFSMSGGTFCGKTGADDYSGLELYAGLPELTDGIWMSAPDDGYFEENTESDCYEAYDSSGQMTHEVRLEKVTGISVSNNPSGEFYRGDVFDPEGLVLGLTFAGGSTAALSYNETHKDMFRFDPEEPVLGAGNNPIRIDCLEQSTDLTITAKDFVSPSVKGTSTTSNVKLEWKAVDGAEKYEIYAGAPGGELSYLGTTESPGFTDAKIGPGEKKRYRVHAIRTNNRGAEIETRSNIVTVTRPLPPKPVITPPKKDDPSGTKFMLLQARAGKVTKSSVQVVWKKVKGAKKYVIYGNKCGSKNKYKKLTTTTKVKLTYRKVAGQKVKKGTYYKFLVYALNSKGKVISVSKTVHVATKGGKVGNDKKVTTAAKKNKVTLKRGKTFKLKAKAIPASKKLKVKRHRKIAYETSNKKIATVSSKGVIKGKKRGTCYVYAYTQNGVFAKVKVMVK